MSTTNAGSSLRIGYIVSMARGLQSFVYREVRELLALGVRVDLFPTKQGSGPYLPESSWAVHAATIRTAIAAHVRVILNRPKEYLACSWEATLTGGLLDFVLAVFISDYVRMNAIQLLHCHFGDHKLFVGYFCQRLIGVPVTVTIHAYELYNNPNPRLFRRALGAVSGIVTVAKFNKTVLVEKYGIDPGRIRVIHLFADIPLEPVPEATVADRVVVLCVGRFVEKKGHRVLLEALRRLPRNFEAWLVGNGPIDIRKLADSLGLATRVKVLDRTGAAELHRVLLSSNVFCLMSTKSVSGDHEGIPVALMEAMAYGLPVISTRHAGIPELVEEILVDEGDFRGLAEALTILGSNPALRRQMGLRNRKIVSDRFSRTNVLLLKSLFEGLANDPS